MGKNNSNQDFPKTGDHTCSSVGPSPNQYGPLVWKKSQIEDAESGADIKIREQYYCAEN